MPGEEGSYGDRGEKILGERAASERTWAIRFFALVLTIWISTVVTFAVTAVNWSQPVSVAQFALIVVFLLGFAYAFSKRLLSLFLPPHVLPALERLARTPRVAVLYTTMNDVVPECVRAIRQTHPCDLYMLDDSSDPRKREVVDRLAAETGCRVARRPARRGFKAGAINDWLRQYGQAYDYLVLLDADSLLPSDWVERALRYAEHPDNSELAIFQGMINIWNTDTRFAATLAANHLLSQDEWERKLAGYLGAVVCYGHNVLIRVEPLLQVGGFEERYVSEDFATAVTLASQGHGSAFVPLHSWEAMPENVRGFVKRQNKWTRGSMEFFSFVPPAQLPWYKKLLLLMIPWSHFAYIAIMIAMILAVFGRSSSLQAFVAFGQTFLSAPLGYIWSIALFRFIILLNLVTAVVAVAKLLQVRLGFLRFYRARTLSRAIGAIMLPHEVRSIAASLISRRRHFPVTPKDEPPMTLGEILSVGRGTVAFISLLSLGLAFANPVGLYYNILWLLPFYTSPLLLYYYCGPHTRTKLMANGGPRDLLKDPRLATSLDVVPRRRPPRGSESPGPGA